jgi:hypothetical protein
MRCARYVALLLVVAGAGVVGLSATSASAQNGVQEAWVMHLAEPDSGNEARALALDTEGNVIAAGKSFRYSTGSSDYATVKYDGDGTELWVAYYDGLVNAVDEIEAVTTDADGYVYVTGDAQEVGISYTTIKYDPSGAVEWTAVYGFDTSPGMDNQPTDIAVDDSGNVYVTGRGSNLGFEAHYATVKFDPNGTLLWASVWGQDNGVYDEATALAVDATGNVYVTGKTGLDESVYDCVTIKYAPDGTELWVAQYDGPGGGDAAYDIAVDMDGNVYIGGASDEDPGGPGDHDLDFLTIKYAADGTELWVARWDAPDPGHGSVEALALDSEANVYVSGGAGAAYATIKYDTDGTMLWVSQYAGDPGEYDWTIALDLAVDDSANVYVTGQCQQSNGVVRTVSRTIKYTTGGAHEWDIEYGTPWADGHYWPEAIDVDAAGSVFITGSSQHPVDGAMFTTVKYTQEPTAADDGSPHLTRLWLSPCSPNPCSERSAIQYRLARPGIATLTLFNVAGETVAVLAQGSHAAGGHSVTVSTRSLPPGVYFYRLEAEGIALGRRLVVID